MMSMNLKDYVKIYDAVDLTKCDVIVNQLKNADWQMHTFYQSDTKKFISHDKELSVAYLQTVETADLQNQIWHIINRYIRTDFGFMSPWYDGWQGYSQVRFNRYNEDTRMKLHCDHIHSMFDGDRKGIPTLSILGALNDDYEGGDLIFWESEKIQLKAGQIMVFPSNFMYPHRVDEVTKGTRYSYVSWVW